jgi:hypothetical protein
MRFYHNISERNMPRGVFSSSLPRALKKYAAITWSLKAFWQKPRCASSMSDFPIPGLPLTQSTPLWLGRPFRSCHCWNCAVLNSQSARIFLNRFDVVPTSINAREAKRTQAILIDSLFIGTRIGQVRLSLGTWRSQWSAPNKKRFQGARVPTNADDATGINSVKQKRSAVAPRMGLEMVDLVSDALTHLASNHTSEAVDVELLAVPAR